jgi:hypothetical protein
MPESNDLPKIFRECAGLSTGRIHRNCHICDEMAFHAIHELPGENQIKIADNLSILTIRKNVGLPINVSSKAYSFAVLGM